MGRQFDCGVGKASINKEAEGDLYGTRVGLVEGHVTMEEGAGSGTKVAETRGVGFRHVRCGQTKV